MRKICNIQPKEKNFLQIFSWFSLRYISKIYWCLFDHFHFITFFCLIIYLHLLLNLTWVHLVVKTFLRLSMLYIQVNNAWSIDFVCLCLSKTLAITKPIAVTQLSDTGEMETVTDIKIDLSKLQRLNEYFGLSGIQEEVTFQLGHVGKMVMLYRSGNPIKDSPNPLGKRHFVYNFVTVQIVQIFYN